VAINIVKSRFPFLSHKKPRIRYRVMKIRPSPIKICLFIFSIDIKLINKI
jgi:hypothetical protein